MWKKHFLTHFTLFLLLFSLGGCGLASPDMVFDERDNFPHLGFCPTMESEALAFQHKNPNVILMPLESAAEVLRHISTGQIDLAIVGRKAKQSEIPPKIDEKNLETEPRYTLIAPQKQMILVSELSSLDISTCLDETIQDPFPELSLKVQTECDYDNGAVWFVAWSDMTDEMELLIPVNEKGEKIRTFRNAFLYGFSFQNLQF